MRRLSESAPSRRVADACVAAAAETVGALSPDAVPAPALYRLFALAWRGRWVKAARKASVVRRDSEFRAALRTSEYTTPAVLARGVGRASRSLTLMLPGTVYVQLVVLGVQLSVAHGQPWSNWMAPLEAHLAAMTIVVLLQVATVAAAHAGCCGELPMKYLAAEATRDPALQRLRYSRLREPLLSPGPGVAPPTWLGSGDRWALRGCCVMTAASVFLSVSVADGHLNAPWAVAAAPAAVAFAAYSVALAAATLRRRLLRRGSDEPLALLSRASHQPKGVWHPQAAAARATASILVAVAAEMLAVRADLDWGAPSWTLCFIPLHLLVLMVFAAIVRLAWREGGVLPVSLVGGTVALCLIVFLGAGGVALDGMWDLDAHAVFVWIWVLPTLFLCCMLFLCATDECCCHRRFFKTWWV
eukprot:TRINITY_DN13251_c0_g1_i2.p1 TRINITY_DN13251_c0_g1~~TRINITY_DN13251_c0_g1_i2.p1  ORF type:complete len:415 (+),score=84.41 TRINITY_DN13251_c0_g1_i2:223-1467(+)